MELDNPKLIWTILTANIKILGPWQESKGRNWSHPGALARFIPLSESHVTVVKSRELKKPEPYEYYIFDNYMDYEYEHEHEHEYEVDDEAYEKALKDYRWLLDHWKPWTY